MYLHEAMEKLFRQVGRSMTTKEIAEKLNENKWYYGPGIQMYKRV